MFKFLTHRMTFLNKLILFFFLTLCIFSSVIYILFNCIQRFLLDYHGISLNLTQLIHDMPTEPLVYLGLFFLIIGALFFFDHYYFIREINVKLSESLEDRKLNSNFSEFFGSRTYFSLIKNIKGLLSLYKSFDNMKTARIVLEVATIRHLMNAISEGVLLISKDRVITHINHIAETQLGLIPGEAVGQAMTRKINNDIILSSVEKVFDFDHKYVDIDIKENQCSISLYPLKDKFGEIIRTLIILTNISLDNQSSAKISTDPESLPL